MMIRDRLRDKALRDGTWEGVSGTVAELRSETGQRIRLVDRGGIVLVDTDHLDGRAARPPGAVTTVVDPVPKLQLSTVDRDPGATTMDAIREYRIDRPVTACLFRRGLAFEPTSTAEGLPGRPRPADPRSLSLCPDRRKIELSYRSWSHADRLEVRQCGKQLSCLQNSFQKQVMATESGPQPLLLTIGASDEPRPVLDTRPIMLITAVVAVLVTAGALLISRRVLRPIGTLTTAARRLGSGDRDGRVPDNGRDEIGELARAFNHMADSLRAAEADQRRLIADVAHELRTPLTNLRGYLEAIQDGVLEPTPELFASLHDEVIHNQRIVDDLQELALAEAGALVYDRAPTDLAELMATVRTAHRADLVVEADGPLIADVDADRIRQAVGNLVANALRATASGGTVTLRSRLDGDRAVLEVSDTGVGIAAEHLPLVFDRLWRADAARGRDSGGSGLGLAIVRQIVRDHGGDITAASTPGAGSTFTIVLPAGAAAASPRTCEPPTQPSAADPPSA